MSNLITLKKNTEIIEQSKNLLDEIRSIWKAKSLIQRVERLLEVDPSSACQRIFNASIHDLKEKVIIAGLDIAGEAAKIHKLPPIDTEHDIREGYPTSKLIDLAYRMGLLSRQAWRSITRCYAIRGDLEHEDDQYEASSQDCFYIFKTCIEYVLSIDPIHLLKIKDINDLIEQPESVILDETLLEDFKHAPEVRQEEILKMLISKSLNKKETDIVQQNAFAALGYLRPLMKQDTQLKIGVHMQDKFGRKPLNNRQVRIAYTIGALPYLRKKTIEDFFNTFFHQLEYAGYGWESYGKHSELLQSFKEYGYFSACHGSPKKKILKWLVLAYLGKTGGITRWGNVRLVYNSDTAESPIKSIIKTDAKLIKSELIKLQEDEEIKKAIADKNIAQRLEELLDIVEI